MLADLQTLADWKIRTPCQELPETKAFNVDA